MLTVMDNSEERRKTRTEPWPIPKSGQGDKKEPWTQRKSVYRGWKLKVDWFSKQISRVLDMKKKFLQRLEIQGRLVLKARKKGIIPLGSSVAGRT